MLKVKDIAAAIEKFAPRELQESWDNVGLQIGDPDMAVNAVLLCLDVTEEVIEEAERRECNMIVSHHPLLFRGLKSITGSTSVQRIAIRAIRGGIAVYSAHTNLDSAREGISYEIAHSLGISGLKVLSPRHDDPSVGLGVVGDIEPTPKMEFLRRVRDTFHIRQLRFSAESPQIVIRRVAVCGGSGAEFIPDALAVGADCYVTGDVKYHDFTTYGMELLIADIGHYESELCARKILSRIIRKAFPDFPVFVADAEASPIKYL